MPGSHVLPCGRDTVSCVVVLPVTVFRRSSPKRRPASFVAGWVDVLELQIHPAGVGVTHGRLELHKRPAETRRPPPGFFRHGGFLTTISEGAKRRNNVRNTPPPPPRTQTAAGGWRLDVRAGA